MKERMTRLGLVALFWLGCSGSEACQGQPVTAQSPQPPPDHEAVLARRAAAATASSAASSAVRPEAPERTGSQLQQALDCVMMDKRVLPYFHVDTQPNRKPLVIQKSDLFANEPPLTMFGMPVIYRTQEQLRDKKVPYLEITKVSFNADRVDLAFLYPIEGVSCSAQVVLSASGCEVHEMRLVER